MDIYKEYLIDIDGDAIDFIFDWFNKRYVDGVALFSCEGTFTWSSGLNNS